MARVNNNGGAAYQHGDNGASFEQSFSRLQEVVQKLSEGNLTLQQALSAFEEGMELADACAKMLDEAELRVKQVSDRALRDGSASVIQLDQVMRAAPVADEDDDEPELLSFEIETFESTILFDAPQRKGSGARSQRSDAREDQQVRNGKPKSEGPKAGYSASEQNHKSLDPLFDEDD